MIYTGPNLAHIVSLISRYMKTTRRAHWEVVKWVFKYMKRSMSEGLMYTVDSRSNIVVIAYVDAD